MNGKSAKNKIEYGLFLASTLINGIKFVVLMLDAIIEVESRDGKIAACLNVDKRMRCIRPKSGQSHGFQF